MSPQGRRIVVHEFRNPPNPTEVAPSVLDRPIGDSGLRGRVGACTVLGRPYLPFRPFINRLPLVRPPPISVFGHITCLLDVWLVDDGFARKDVLEVPRHDDQQVLRSTGRRRDRVPEAWFLFFGKQIPTLELDPEDDLDPTAAAIVPILSQQSHIGEGLRGPDKPVERPSVIGVPDLPHPIQALDDLNLDRPTENATETEQIANVQALHAGRGLKIRRQRADRIPYVVDKRCQPMLGRDLVPLRSGLGHESGG